MTDKNNDSLLSATPIWKDGLYCLLTALGFLALIALTVFLYAQIENKLPKPLRAPLGFFEYLFIIQSPSFVPLFRAAQKQGGFPNIKHLIVVVDIALLIWLVIEILKSGSAIAQLLGVLVFAFSLGIAFSPVIAYFTIKGHRKITPREA